MRVAATQEAEQLSADFIGTEHLFLAWIRHARGPIADAVSASGLTADTFIELIAKSRKPKGRGRSAAAEDEATPLSSHAQKVVDLAIEKAREAGREEPSADDMVLAMIQEPRGVIARALTEYDLKPSRLRALVSNRVGSRRGVQAAAPAPTAEPAADSNDGVETPSAASQPKQQNRRAAAAGGAGATRKAGTRASQPPAAAPEQSPRPAPSVSTPTPPVAAVEDPPRSIRLVTSSGTDWGVADLLLLGVPVALASLQFSFRADLVLLAAVLGLAGIARRATVAAEQLGERTSGGIRALARLVLPAAVPTVLGVALVLADSAAAAVSTGIGAAAASAMLVLGVAMMAVGPGRGPLLQAAGRTESTAMAAALLVVPALLLVFAPDALGSLESLVIAVATALLISAAGVAMHASLRSAETASASGDVAEAAAPDGTWPVTRSLVEVVVGTAVAFPVAIVASRAIAPVGEGGVVPAGVLALFLVPLVIQLAAGSTAIRAGRLGSADIAHRMVGRQMWAILTVTMPVVMIAGILSGVDPAGLLVSPWPAVVLLIAVAARGVSSFPGRMTWREGLQLVLLYTVLVAGSWLSR